MRFALVSSVLTSFALAQPPLFSPSGNATTEGNTANGYPFSIQTAFSYQQLHGDLNGKSATIARLSFRRDGVLATNAGYTAKTIDASLFFGGGETVTCTNTFLSNYSTASTAVLAPKSLNLPNWTANVGSPAPWSFLIPLDAPYAWNGATDFIWEIRVTSMSSTSFVPCDAIALAATPINGLRYGTACTSAGATSPFTLDSSLTSSLTTDMRWQGSSGPSGAAAVMLLGVVGVSVPVPGMCTNLYVNPVVSLSGAVSSFPPGVFTFGPLSFPNVPGNVGLHLFTQVAAVDASRTDPIKLSVTNGVDCTVAARTMPEIARLFASGSATATTGSLEPGLSLIIRLD